MRFLERLLPKMYITLIPDGNGHLVYGELRKEKRVIKRFVQQKLVSREQLLEKLKVLGQESASSYIVLLDTLSKQGVLNSCGEIEGVESSSIERLCLGSWGIYIEKDDLFERQKEYKQSGLDLLFSPYALLHHFFSEEIAQRDGLYLLITAEWMVMMVFKGQRALYGEMLYLEEVSVLEADTMSTERYLTRVQESVKRFYDTKVDATMFIEHLYIADAIGLDVELENRLEELLFVDVIKRQITLASELAALAEKELI